MISIGIDVGSYSIKVAEVESSSRSYAIRRLIEIPLNLDPQRDQRIEVIDTLRSLLDHYDHSSTQFVFSIAQKNVSSRYIFFPFAERFKIQKAVVSELEDEIPLAVEDSIFEAKIVRLVGKGADVLAMATPKEVARARLNFAHDCGVDTRIISCDGLALANHFENWAGTPPEVSSVSQEIPADRNAEIVLNIGHSSTIALIYAEGILTAVRYLDWGIQMLVDGVVQKYHLNPLQALREVQSKGGVILDKSVGTKDQQVFSETFETKLELLVNDLRLIMLELQSEFKLKWTKGSMLGGGAKFKNLGAYLTHALQVPFNKINPVEKHPSTFTEGTPQLEASCAIAVGLAIEGIRRPRNPATSFLKGDLARPSQTFENFWNVWGHTLRLAALAFVIFSLYAIFRDSLGQTLLEASDQALRVQAESIAGIKGRPPSAGKIQKFIRDQERIEKSRMEAEKLVRMNSALDVLNAINQNLPNRNPNGFEIKRISIMNDVAEVHGYSASQSELKNIEDALKRTSTNGKLQRVGPRITTPKGKTAFAFRFALDRS